MAGLGELLSKKGAASAAPVAPPAGLAGTMDRMDEMDGMEVRAGRNEKAAPGVVIRRPGGITLDDIEGIVVQAVVGGALQEITLREGTNPAHVLDFLRGLDPNAKVRDDFPKGGFGGGGKRDTKTARVVALNIDVREAGKFINMTASVGTDDFTVSVGRKHADEWLGKLEALGKLDERTVAKVRAAFENKKATPVMLRKSEQFGVTYWTTEDGKAFMEEMKPEPPAEAAAAAEGED